MHSKFCDCTVDLDTVFVYSSSVAKDTSLDWELIYDFVSDRLRAVRQDMIIQSLGAKESAVLLELMVEFYLSSAYR